MIAILKRELKSYFTTPYGYVFLFSFTLICGLITFFTNIQGRNSQFAQSTLSFINTLMMILTPMLTMKIFTDDKRQNTDQLLYSSPTSVAGIVAGKFFAALAVFIGALAVTLVYPFCYSFFARMDWAQILGSYIGLIFIGGCYIAVGLFISCSTENQAAAAVLTLLTLLVIALLDTVSALLTNFSPYPWWNLSGILFLAAVVAGLLYWFHGSHRNIKITVIPAAFFLAVLILLYILNPAFLRTLIVQVIGWFSLNRRFMNFPQGVLKFSELTYYLTFIGFFLLLTVQKIEKKSWS